MSKTKPKHEVLPPHESEDTDRFTKPVPKAPLNTKEYKRWECAALNNPCTTRLYSLQIFGGVVLLWALSGWITYMAAR